MSYKIRCSACGNLSKDLLSFKCRSCGQPLDVQLDLDFGTKLVRKRDYSVWRYANFFPYVRKSEIISLGEGWTPLVKFTENVCFKLESLNPTGSFKDRGSTTLISAIHRSVNKQKGYISEDSSGNAGASMAAYAARAGLKAKVFVPETVAGPKLNQIRSYGAEIIRVAGSRKRVAQEAQEWEARKFYVGHIFHPLFRDGIRSLAYEIVEQLGWKIPEYVYLPVSAGTLLLGVISGFKHLASSNVIRSVPKIVACQTRQVSPLYHRFKNLSYSPPERITSIADALVSVAPPLLELMVKNLKEVNGEALIVEEEEVLEAFNELARKGFFVEPSSAVAFVGYKKQIMKKRLPTDSSTVVVLTGTGLKTTLTPK